MYAGQLDRFIANEISVMLSADVTEAVAEAEPDVTAEEIRAATTVTETRGTDVVVIQVRGLGGDLNTKVNRGLLSEYSDNVKQRAEASVADPMEDVDTRLTELQTQIDATSEDIATAVSRARRSAPNAVADPSWVAPAENSRLALLQSQYSKLLDEQASLVSQQQNAASGVEVIAQPTTVRLGRPLSVFTALAALLGGATLGLAAALIRIRLRKQVKSWQEVDGIVDTRPWTPLESRGVLGRPGTAVHALGEWLADSGDPKKPIRLGVADLPGRETATEIVQDAIDRMAERGTTREVNVQVVPAGETHSELPAIVVPYRKGLLSKDLLREHVSAAPPETQFFVIAI